MEIVRESNFEEEQAKVLKAAINLEENSNPYGLPQPRIKKENDKPPPRIKQEIFNAIDLEEDPHRHGQPQPRIKKENFKRARHVINLEDDDAKKRARRETINLDGSMH